MKFKLVLSALVVVAFTSCKEEEFYEKEYIDTVKEQYERANLPDEDTNDPDNAGYLPDDSGSGDGGSGDGGSGDGGSGDGGSGDGGSGDGGSGDGGANTVPRSDSFTQSANGGKLDILWVIDNSGSMGDEQEALGDNFNAFISDFITKNIDFQMAVTTTDTRSQYAGMAFSDSQETLTSAKLAEDENQFLADFARNVNVGVNGSAYEKGIKASYAFTNRYHANWMREDAYYVVVYMSDEEDQSEASVSAYLNAIKGKKDNDGLVRAYSIVEMVDSFQDGAISRGYERYKEASDSTNGEVADIREDFYMTLLNMGEQIATLADQFPLSRTPYSQDSIEVKVDGAVSTDWQYVEATNAIQFGTAPADGAQIEVNYDVAQ